GGYLRDRGQAGGAAQEEVASAEYPRVADAGRVVQQGVQTCAAEVLEHVAGDGQVLGASGRGARGNGVEEAPAGPEHVRRPALHALDVGGEILVGPQRHAAAEAIVGSMSREAV